MHNSYDFVEHPLHNRKYFHCVTIIFCNWRLRYPVAVHTLRHFY